MSTPEVVDVEQHWPVEESTEVYDGGGWVVRVRADRVRRPGHPEERPFTRVVVEHPGAAVVLAVDEQGRALCLWQYRHAVGHRLVQLPAGLIDVEGEDAAEVARRELREEAGLEAAEWTHVATMLSSPGLTEERAHYYLARGLTDVGRGDFELEHEEAEMEVAWVPLAELRAAVLSGAVADAHVALALLTAEARGLLAP